MYRKYRLRDRSVTKLKQVIGDLGVEQAASLCGISPRAVYKWLAAGRLPRTEYTGETGYAEILTAASSLEVTAGELLISAKPTAA